jgi:hypothetical protein
MHDFSEYILVHVQIKFAQDEQMRKLKLDPESARVCYCVALSIGGEDNAVGHATAIGVGCPDFCSEY